MTPYQNTQHRKDCGCSRLECVRLREMAEQLAQAEMKRDARGAENTAASLTSTSTDRSGHPMATQQRIKPKSRTRKATR